MKDCNQCGKCCIKYSAGGLSASSSEVQWWQTFRPEIAEYVKDGEIWVDPNSREPLTLCPWLAHDEQSQTYHCRIYFDRPEDCRHYPVNVTEMIADECEMLELRDLTDLSEAQKQLDRRMIDSRPPAG